jgi:hypothetical protein
MKLEELILLALRVLAILLMGAALARPLLSRAHLVPFTKSGTDVVVILDDSYSMAQKHGADTAFAKAQKGVLQVAKQIGKQDTFAVFLTSRAEPLFPPGYLTDWEAFKNEVNSLTPSDFATDLVGPVQRALRVFENSKNPEKRLYLLSDFRRREWSLNANGSQGRRVAALLSALDRKRFKAILADFASEDTANLTVTELTCAAKHIVKNVAVQFRVSVTNNGPQTATSISVTLQVGDVKLPGRILDRLDPGQSKSVEFSYRFKDAGPAAVTASIPGDQLAPDNAAFLALNVVAAVPVLVVNGNPDPQPFVNEADYLVTALDPGHKNLSGFRPETVLAPDLSNVRLSAFDCVVLGNVGSLPPETAKALEDYVRAGGGLVIFLGDRIDREFYNTQLFKDGRGLLPLALDAPRGDLETRQKFAKLRSDAVIHPVLAVFTGAGEQLLDLVPFYFYFPLRADAARAGEVSVLASLVDPSVPTPTPAIVEKPFGTGRVIQIASSMNAAWNDWPKSISYPIVVNEMVSYLSRAPRHENTQSVGAPLRREVEPEFFDAAIMLKTPRFPDEDAIKVAPKLVGEQMFVAWPPLAEAAPAPHPPSPSAERDAPGLDHAGIYTLELNSGAKTHRDYFARNVNPDEGRLEKADVAVIAQTMKDVPHEFRQEIAAPETPSTAGGKELWRIVLFVLLGMLVIETILAQRFGHYSQ